MPQEIHINSEFDRKKLPQALQDNIRIQYDAIDSRNIDIFNPESLTKRTFGILLSLDDKSKEIIYEALNTKIPNELRETMIMQPKEGYHISLQWTPDQIEQSHKMDDLVQDISKVLLDMGTVKGSIYFPFLSPRNLFAGFVENGNQVTKVREKLNEVWESRGLNKGVKDLTAEFYWISLVRFKRQLDQGEIEVLKNLAVTMTEGIELSMVNIALNDPFFSPDGSKILKVETFR